jgi:hypothetical protein
VKPPFEDDATLPMKASRSIDESTSVPSFFANPVSSRPHFLFDPVFYFRSAGIKAMTRRMTRAAAIDGLQL